MTGTGPAKILRYLEHDSATDGELLAAFIRQEESVFARIVRRHGPVVLDVCRRITRHEQDAEDAFQAVFLTLAQRAVKIRSGQSLGYWLYGVAVRVSQRARRSSIRRRAREIQVVNVPEPFLLPNEQDPDLGHLLQEELAKLPSHYREAIVACDLLGGSRADAARALGVPEGTVSSRLAGGRKKLAIRLAHRGIVLSATVVPTVLGSDSAVASVPDSLVSKTCGLVAGWRAGAMVPDLVLRLTQGGFVMRRMLVLGMTCLALTAAGAIFAGQQAVPPKPDAPQPKVEQRAANADLPAERNNVHFGPPRLQQAFDTGLSGGFVSKLHWSPDGRRLAISGIDRHNKQAAVYVFSMGDNDTSEPSVERITPGSGMVVVGFTPDSKNVATELREYHLVSGRHKLTFWEPKREDPPQTTSMKPVRTVKLESDPTFGYTFAPDGKTYRTIAPEADDGPTKKLQVREVSASTGKTMRILLQAEGEFDSYQLSSAGNRLVTAHQESIVIHDIPNGKKKTLPFPRPKAHDNPPAVHPATAPSPILEGNPSLVQEDRKPITVAISPNSKVVFASRGESLPILLDADTGKALPQLQGDNRMSVLAPLPESFSSDGRLLAVIGSRTRKDKVEAFLHVWDTRTGKVLKSWSIYVQEVAFHPTKPLLAIVERNGDQTRFGLWDFSAEVADGR